MIDLLKIVNSGTFKSGTLTDSQIMENIETLPWNGNPEDNRGFIRLINNAKCEDGKNYNVLQMHPKWANFGTIKAWLPWITIGENPIFEAKVGFLKGAKNTDGVTFQVWEHHMFEGKEVWNRVLNLKKEYTNELVQIEADLSHLSNQKVSIELRVDAGKSSGQDWAVWSDLKIASRKGVSGNAWEISPKSLTVNSPNDNWFRGLSDEPYIAALYFRSILGKQGTTKTKPLLKLKTISQNVKKGETVSIDISDELHISDSIVAHELDTIHKGIQIMGYIMIPMEEDESGKDIVRKKVKKLEELLSNSLKQRIENDKKGPLFLGDAFKEIIKDVFPTNTDANISKDETSLFKNLKVKITDSLGDDQFEITIIIVLGLSDSVLKQLKLKDKIKLPSFVKLTSPKETEFSLVSKDNQGAKYTVNVELKKTSVSGNLVN